MTDERKAIYTNYEKLLTPYSTSLVAEFRRSADAISELVSDEELTAWADEGLELAKQSWRSWEAAGEYYRVTPHVLPMLGSEGFSRWAKYGRELAELSSALAASYFRASPATIPEISYARMGEWMNLGKLLYKGTWRSASLAVQFFDGSPHLFSKLTLEEGRVLVRFVDALCDRSYDLASHCLTIAPGSLDPLTGEDRIAFLTFAEALASTGWADARSYLEKGPGLLAHVQQLQRGRFLNLARELARREGRQAFAFFAEAARALSRVESESHGLLLSLAEELVVRSPLAAMEFLKTASQVLERIPVDTIADWHAEGSALLDQSQEGGEAYFRMESSRGEEMLDSLSSRVDLSRVADVLRMYGKALTGVEVAVHSAESLAEKGIGWVETELPSTEGTAIFLPPHVEEFHDKDDNFGVYKVFCTHQAGHLEFGTFDFEFERPGAIFPTTRLEAEANNPPSPAHGRGAGGRGLRPTPHCRWTPTATSTSPAKPVPHAHQPLTDMERFFDLFPDRRLASDIFAAVEDARIDVMIGREYLGIRRSYGSRQERELARRPEIREMPLRQAFVENLVRISLGGIDEVRWPEQLMPIITEAIGIIRLLQDFRGSGSQPDGDGAGRSPQAHPSKTPPRPPSSSTASPSRSPTSSPTSSSTTGSTSTTR